MTSIAQFKAARALLDWTQADLAKAARLHLNVINNIERSITNPRQGTVARIKTALEAQGVVFLGERGVELARQAIATMRMEGDGFLKTLTDDILTSVPAGGEVLSLFADIRSFGARDPESSKRFYALKAEKGFQQRLITSDMPGFYPRNAENYRVLPAQTLQGADMVVYADKVALIHWAAREATVLKSDAVAQTHRRLFEALWASGTHTLSHREREG